MQTYNKELTELLAMKRAEREQVRADNRRLNKEIRDLETKIADLFSEQTAETAKQEAEMLAAWNDGAKEHWKNDRANKLLQSTDVKYPYIEDQSRTNEATP
jgi:phage shock protein A